MKATDAELTKSDELCGKIALWSTFFVFVGLVFEGYIAYEHRPYESCLERWGSFGADVLVALGVLGELIPSMFGRAYQTELVRRANAKTQDAYELSLLAHGSAKSASGDAQDALQKLAKATDRAAALEKEAAEARERTALLEQLTMWRRVSPKQRAEIQDVIREASAEIDLLIDFQMGDPESCSYAQEFSKIFADAGVSKIRFGSNAHIGMTRFGLYITSGSEFNGTTITDAFVRAGISIAGIQKDDFPWGTVPVPNLYIFVGPKTPPNMIASNDNMRTNPN